MEVIITCVHYLGPPGPFSFPDSRDLPEVLGGLPDRFSVEGQLKRRAGVEDLKISRSNTTNLMIKWTEKQVNKDMSM